jgi:hypothetical protein
MNVKAVATTAVIVLAVLAVVSRVPALSKIVTGS